MKKYIVLAFLPIFFQSNLYCQDINEVIKPQLQMARMLMNNNTPLEFQAILDALVFLGKRGKIKQM